MSREDLKGEIRALRNEVELSTYINKGAIVENKELKSRVSELERENVALRTTERRLTETEEKLEDCEQIIKDQEREILKLENTASDLRTALRQAAREKDRRSDIWKQMRRLMDSEDAASEPLENEAGPSTSRTLRSRPSAPLERVTEERPPREATRSVGRPALATLFDEEEVGGPSKQDRDDARSHSNKKKKRRIGQGSEPEDDPYTPARPVTPVDQTRPPSGREKRRPTIQLGIVKLESLSPDQARQELRSAPKRRSNRGTRDDDDEESDDALGQW